MLLRRWLLRLNLAVVLVLLGVLFILVNFVASRRYVRVDLTKTRISALSEKTTQVLKQLKEPVQVIIFYQPTHRLYELVQDLLKEYERLSTQLRVEYVDPEQDIARAQQLVQQFDIGELDVQRQFNLVIFQVGTRHKYLSDTDLAEYDYSAMSFGGQPGLKAFKAEEAFTSAILSVTQARQPLVWVTTGHGEKGLEDQEPPGLSELKKYLERENTNLESVTLLEKSEISESVNALIIPGPTRRFVEQELLLLQAFLDRGGRLLALVDPQMNTGLDGLLTRWGIELGNDIVVDPARRLPFVSAANLFVTTYTQHPIVEHMETLLTLFPLARSVQPGTPGPELTVTSLALTSPDGWGETQTETSPFAFTEGEDTKGPVSIAVAAERPASTPTRLVVIGDSDFAANGQVGNVGNLDLALGAFHWLVEQEQLIGIGPKTLESIRLTLTASQMQGIFWLSFAGLPSVFVLLGVVMWWCRRR